MEEIEVGEYVRDEDGLLGKCTNKYCDSVRLDLQDGTIIATVDHRGYKHSKNIIDLIEEGDIVEVKNGRYIDKYGVIEQRFGKCVYIIENDYYETLDKLEIKTILTHEQYENNCYRLENK